MTPLASLRVPVGALLLLLLAPLAAAQTTYDYASRTQGSDIFAYDGLVVTQVPTTATTPVTELSAAEYDAIESNDGTFHTLSTVANQEFVQHRFRVRIDEAEASVTQIDASWNGRGANQNNGRTDGASLYIWNYTAGAYELLQVGADTEAEVTLSGSVTASLIDYIGGAAQDEITLLAVTTDRQTGTNKFNRLQSDYVSVTVTAGAAAYFTLGHDGTGIHCVGETITVTARLADGSVDTGYSDTVTLDTRTGKGTWSNGAANQGSFSDATPNDGLASYTFDPADAGVAMFVLTYLEGTPTLDIDLFQTSDPGIRDDDTEGTMTFAPSGFTVTASPLANPPPNPINDPIPAQTAGSDFTLYLAVYGQTPTDPDCGLIESYTGAHLLKLWSSYSDPASGTRQVTIDGSAIATTEAAAASQAVAFAAGQAQVTAKYKDVGRIQIHMKDDTVSEPVGGIVGATNPFVVRPADLAIVDVTRPDSSPNPGESVPTGVVFVAAGDPFVVRVEVLDAEGDRTPNYGNETLPEGILLTSSTLVAPAGGRNGSADDGTIGNGTAFAAIAPAGTFSGNTFSWDEVGAIRLQASIGDGDYLGAGDVAGTESSTVGRFTPFDFAAVPNAPVFDTGCAAGGFTYLAQPFDYAAGSEPVIGLTARAAAGTTTRNYTGAWWRITNAHLDSTGNRTYAAASGTLDPNGLPDTTVDPAIFDAGDGTGTLTFSAGTGLTFERNGLAPPFDAELSLSLDVSDLDGIAPAANPVRFGLAAPGAGIAFSAGKEQRFGRLVVQNAHGSELVPLDQPIQAQHFAGPGFVTNAADACTSVAVGSLLLTRSPPALPTASSIANDPLAAGDAGHSLGAPGAGNDGTVDVQANLLGATLPWLRYDWPHDGNLDGSYDDDPIGRATFGIFAGDDPVIYLREIY